MRDQLKVQELMDTRLDSMSEELHQLCSQSQEDGARMATSSIQLQEVISSVEARSKVMEKDLEEINGQFDCHRGEINHLQRREEELKEKEEELTGYVLGAAHEAEIFKSQLDQMEQKSCCQEIGLVALMFFFELFIFLYSSQFPSMFPLLTYSQSLFSLSADYLRHSRRRRSKIQFY